MEPRQSSAENVPQAPQPEQWVNPGVAQPNSEMLHRRSEQLHPVIDYSASEVRAEVAGMQPVASTGLPAPVPPAAQSVATVSSDDTPLSASDEDVIEKEWVDKAKQIISETRNDPHARETRIKKLQIDYLRKRYGREIGEQPVA